MRTEVRLAFLCPGHFIGPHLMSSRHLHPNHPPSTCIVNHPPSTTHFTIIKPSYPTLTVIAGIPFRRGYLLYGAPGAGKTSMIHSIAGELGLHIYILSLTSLGLDDNSLKALISHLPRACIVLIEDIDAAFTNGSLARSLAPFEGRGARASRPTPDSDDEDDGPGGSHAKGAGNQVTLSGLLNALDGIAAQEGRILFATTNAYGALDPALLRPGRLDLHIEFQLASAHQAAELFRRFYTAVGDSESESDPRPPSGASDAHPGGDDEKRALSPLGPDPDASSTSSAAPLPSPSSSSPPSGAAHRPHPSHEHKPQLTHAEAAALAAEFSAIIPARTFSMATLQGYLMAYKVRPRAAVADAPAWVARKLQEAARPSKHDAGAAAGASAGTSADVASAIAAGNSKPEQEVEAGAPAVGGDVDVAVPAVA